MPRYRLITDVKNNRDLAAFVMRITGLSVILALALDIPLQSLVLFTSWQAAIYSWIGTVGITLLVAIPVTLTIGRAYKALYFARQEIERQSRTDEMTGLANRRGFIEAVEKLEGRPYVVAIADIDLFKAVNDTHGHSAGDAVIRKVADVLRAAQGGRGVLCRMGGEEFVWMVAEADPAEVFRSMNEARIALASGRTPAGGAEVRVTISCGIAPAAPGADIDTAYKAADRALYSAKAGGRNRVWMDRPDGPVTEPPLPTLDDLGWLDTKAGPAAA